MPVKIHLSDGAVLIPERDYVGTVVALIAALQRARAAAARSKEGK